MIAISLLFFEVDNGNFSSIIEEVQELVYPTILKLTDGMCSIGLNSHQWKFQLGIVVESECILYKACTYPCIERVV